MKKTLATLALFSALNFAGFSQSDNGISTESKKDKLSDSISIWIDRNVDKNRLVTGKDSFNLGKRTYCYTLENRYIIHTSESTTGTFHSKSKQAINLNINFRSISDQGKKDTTNKMNEDLTFNFDNIDSIGDVYTAYDFYTCGAYGPAIKILLHNPVTVYIKKWGIDNENTDFSQAITRMLLLPVDSLCNDKEIEKFRELIKEYKSIE